MSNTFKHLTQQDIEEGREFLVMYSNLSEMERMQVKLYINALSDRNEIEMENSNREKAVKAG